MTRGTPMAISVSMRQIYVCVFFFRRLFFFFFVVPFRIDAQSREKVIASGKKRRISTACELFETVTFTCLLGHGTKMKSYWN